MEKTNFENLEVYKLSERLADQIWKVVIHWDILAKDTLGKQLVRAADSVGANIAEGSGRGTEPSSGDSYESRAARCMKPSIGCGERMGENS
jgi:hypothetical protein